MNDLNSHNPWGTGVAGRGRALGLLFFCIFLVFLAGMRIGEGSTGSGSGRGETNLTLVPPGEDLPEWKVRLELARILSYLQRFEESGVEYREVLRLNPESVVARQELSRVLFWKGEPELALSELEQIPRDTLDDDGLRLKAELLVSVGAYNRAAPLYRDLVESHPEDEKLRYWLAEILSWQGNLKESIGHFEILVRARPSDVPLRRKFGMVLGWDGQFERAARVLRETLPAQP